MSELPICLRVTDFKTNHCFWYGTKQTAWCLSLRICNTTSKIRLQLPHTGSEEVLQDEYRLVVFSKLYAMWNGHGESFVVPRATPRECGSTAHWQLHLRTWRQLCTFRDLATDCAPDSPLPNAIRG